MSKEPAITIEYVKITPLKIDITDETHFKQEITLQSQGQVVEFSDKTPIRESALAFACAYEVASEAVLRKEDGSLILLFSHHEQEFLRPEEVDESFFQEVQEMKKKAENVRDIAMPVRETIIDLSFEWNSLKKERDERSKILSFIQKIPSFMRAGMNVVLQGDIPSLPLLYTVYFARSYGYTVFYMDDHGDRTMLFKE